MLKERFELLNFKDLPRRGPRPRADAGDFVGLPNFDFGFLQLLRGTRLEMLAVWELLLEDG
jgi:hypothetical protein